MSARSVVPIAQQLDLLPVYGNPKKLLAWDAVNKDLEEARTYWISSVRPDGRPHVVPKDGVWLEDTLYYGGDEQTVHHRNLTANSAAVMHIGDEMKAVIVEGSSTHITPAPDVAQRIAEITNIKYAHYGMNVKAGDYTSKGTWALVADKVLAWNILPEYATRFTFSRD